MINDSMFNYKKQESKKKATFDQLLELISNGNFKEGEKLPSERDLAQILNVSRNVLRESIVELTAKGLIEVRERQGIYVRKIDQDGTIDTLKNMQLIPGDFELYQLEVRIVISVPAARLAAQRRTEDDIRKLNECYDNFIRCPFSTPEEVEQNGRWEALLHHLVTEAAHNPILSRINESVNALVEKNNSLVHPNLMNEKGWIEHIQKQHRTIIDAIANNDPKLAGDTLRDHLVQSFQKIAGINPKLLKDAKYQYLINENGSKYINL